MKNFKRDNQTYCFQPSAYSIVTSFFAIVIQPQRENRYHSKKKSNQFQIKTAGELQPTPNPTQSKNGNTFPRQGSTAAPAAVSIESLPPTYEYTLPQIDILLPLKAPQFGIFVFVCSVATEPARANRRRQTTMSHSERLKEDAIKHQDATNTSKRASAV